MRQVFFGLETIPSQYPAVREEILARPKYAANYDIGVIVPDGRISKTDTAALEKSVRERTEKAKLELAVANCAKLGAANEAWRDTALDGWRGHIACIAWGIHDEKVQAADAFLWNGEPTQSLDRFDERVCIEEFLSAVSTSLEPVEIVPGPEIARIHGSAVLIGHNVRRFDIIFLWQRCVVLGIPIPNWLAVAKGARRFSDEFVVDTMELAGNTLSTPFGPKLDKLCLGIQTKTGFDGSQVWNADLAGRFAEVRVYCCDDVCRVRSAFRRLTGLPMLEIDVMTPSAPGAGRGRRVTIPSRHRQQQSPGGHMNVRELISAKGDEIAEFVLATAAQVLAAEVTERERGILAVHLLRMLPPAVPPAANDDGEVIRQLFPPRPFAKAAPKKAAKRKGRRGGRLQYTDAVIAAALEKSGGNRTHAAKALGCGATVVSRYVARQKAAGATPPPPQKKDGRRGESRMGRGKHRATAGDVHA